MFKRKKDIIGQQFMKFFMPTVLMTMALSLSTVVDGMIVGNMLGSEALAAVNLVLPVTLLFNSVYVLLGVGGSTLYSVALGKRDHKRAQQLFTIAVIGMIAVAVAILIIGIFLCGWIAEILTVNANNLTGLVFDYIKFVMLAAPLLIVVPGLVYFIRSTGKVKIASSVLIVANVVNLSFDVLFVGVLRSGIQGAALATGCGYLVGLLIAIYGIKKSKQLRFSKNIQDFLPMLKEIVGTGLPSTINTCLNFFRLTCINIIVMSYLGSDGVTAFSVCISCLSIVSMFVGGSAQTMIPLLGTLQGEKDRNGIYFTIRKAILITGSSTIVLVALFELFPTQIIALFGVTNSVQVSIATEAIRIYAISLPFMGFLFVSMCVYQVIGQKKLSNMVALLEGFVIVVPMAWLLARLFGAVGIWFAFIIGELGTIAILYLLVCRMHKKHTELKGIFLIKDSEERKTMDITMIQTLFQATELSKQTIHFCKENGVSEIIANRVGVALEEMAINTISHNVQVDKRNCIDIRLSVDEDFICIAFRDNGTPFNPLEKKTESEAFNNINIALAMSSEIDYDNILGMNCSIVRIKNRRENM